LAHGSVCECHLKIIHSTLSTWPNDTLGIANKQFVLVTTGIPDQVHARNTSGSCAVAHDLDVSDLLASDLEGIPEAS